MRGRCTALVGHQQTQCEDPSAATDEAGHAVCLYHFGVPAYQFDGDAHDHHPMPRPEEKGTVLIAPDRERGRKGPTQTRRTISVKGLTFERLASHCEQTGESVTAFVESLICDALTNSGVPEESVLRPRAKRRPRRAAPETDAGDIVSGSWTF